MFNPTSTISPGANWMLQSVSKQKQKQRAQALTAAGNEHASAYWGEQNTETAEFTLGGNYEGNVSVPTLGTNGITDWTLTYSETAFPTLSVSRNDAAGGGSFTLPTTPAASAITLPARTLGCPTAIPGIYSNLSGAKQVQIACTCQHVEETNGSGVYGTKKGMRDVTITVTITGVDGKPTVTFAAGWATPSEQEGNSNTAIATGSVVYEKHFAVAAAA